VIIETNAGEGSHYTDKDFSDAGAKIAFDKAEVFKAPILIKSAPFTLEDCGHLQVDQIVISPLHFSLLKKEIIEAMMQKRITALAMGASVKVFDNNVYKLKRLESNIGQRVWTSVIEPKILAKQLKTCEVAVGALNTISGRSPIVVTEHMVANMRSGSVIIDVS